MWFKQCKHIIIIFSILSKRVGLSSPSDYWNAPLKFTQKGLCFCSKKLKRHSPRLKNLPTGDGSEWNENKIGTNISLYTIIPFFYLGGKKRHDTYNCSNKQIYWVNVWLTIKLQHLINDNTIHTTKTELHEAYKKIENKINSLTSTPCVPLSFTVMIIILPVRICHKAKSLHEMKKMK